MKKQIHFEWGSEKQIKIAQAGQKDTFFYEAYRQALAGVTEIVRASMIAVHGPENDPFAASEGADRKRDSGPEFPDDRYFYNYPNNMLVFSGDRGAGKSSAMLSFVCSLQNPKSKLYDELFLKEMVARELPGGSYCSVLNILRGARFIAIPPIDPTTLENSDQILTVILAHVPAGARRLGGAGGYAAAGTEAGAAQSEKRADEAVFRLLPAHLRH